MMEMTPRPTMKDPLVRKLAIEGLAKECAAWDQADVEDWVDIIEMSHISFHDNGYKIAKNLEHYSYVRDIDAELVEILDGASSHKYKAIEFAEQQWVKLHDIKPDFTVGDVVAWSDYEGFKTGTINDMKRETGYYTICPHGEEERFGEWGGHVIAFERVSLATAAA